MRPMIEAPLGEPVLIYAQWVSADGLGGDDDEDPPSWRVARREPWSDQWTTVTSNPYADVALHPHGWCPLPKKPITDAEHAQTGESKP